MGDDGHDGVVVVVGGGGEDSQQLLCLNQTKVLVVLWNVGCDCRWAVTKIIYIRGFNPIFSTIGKNQT